jgi:hypothetical protein
MRAGRGRVDVERCLRRAGLDGDDRMSFTPTLTSRPIGAAALLAAAAIGTTGIIQVTHEPSGESTVVGIERVSIGGLTLMLLALIPVVLALGRAVGRPRFAAVAIAGQVALAALTVVSNMRGEDPAIFAAVAIPSNLLWFGGWVALGVALKRSGLVPALIAIGLPIAWLLALPLSHFGGALLSAAYWATFAWLALHGELLRRRVPALA